MPRLSMRSFFRQAIARVALQAGAGLVPPRCVFCGAKTMPGEGAMCPGCRQELPYNRLACTGCGMPMHATNATTCAECQVRPTPFASVIAPLLYEFPVDAAIKAFKFHRKLFYVPAFTELIQSAAAALPADIDALLPVPLHRRRKLGRGFNQARELARPLGRSLGVPLLENVFRRSPTPYQSGLNAALRQRNLRGAFRINGPLRASHVLLVDDVMTTGATCKCLALLLKENAVSQVSVLVLARAVHH